MKRLRIYIIGFLIISMSCKEEKVEKNLICELSEAEMIDVMVDFSLAKSSKALMRKGLRDSGIKPYEYLFAKHGVDSVIIRENLEYYNQDLSKAKKLYDTLAKILQARADYLQAYVDTLEVGRNTDRDSLTNTIDSLAVDREDFIPVEDD